MTSFTLLHKDLQGRLLEDNFIETWHKVCNEGPVLEYDEAENTVNELKEVEGLRVHVRGRVDP